MKKRWFMSALAGVMTVSVLAGCSSLKEDETAITVGGTEITAGVANFYARYTQAQYESYMGAYLGEDMWSSEAGEGESYEESIKSNIKEDLETMVLLEQHMDEYDVFLSNAEQSVITKTAQEFDDNNALDEKELISGDKETVERVLTLMAVQQKMREAIQAGADTEVSDEEAAQKKMDYVLFSYKTTDEDGKSVDISDEEKEALKNSAAEFAESIKNGGDFAALAGERALEVKPLAFDSETQAPDEKLIDAADALEENGVTDVIETESGCYVAKLTSLLDREATDAKKESIISERKSKLYTDTCDKWRKDTKIEENKSVWKKIKFTDLTVTMKIKEEVPYTDEVKTDDQVDVDKTTAEEE